MIYVSSYLFLSCVIAPDSDLYNWSFWLLSSCSISVSTMLNTHVMSSFIQLVLQIVALSFDLGLSFHIHISITLSFDSGLTISLSLTLWALNILFLSLELRALSTLFLHVLCLPLRHSCMNYLGETFFGITP